MEESREQMQDRPEAPPVSGLVCAVCYLGPGHLTHCVKEVTSSVLGDACKC